MLHYEETASIKAPPKKLFDFLDDHRNLSSHMNNSSLMMGGGSMQTEIDDKEGKQVGSHIKMSGKVMGINLYLDEVVKTHEPPRNKAWQTVGDLNLLVIDHYEMGFEITPYDKGSKLKVYLNYELPKSLKTRWLGILFSKYYAKWCVQQMLISAKQYERRS